MKPSPHMQQLATQLAERHQIDLSQVGVFLRLDMPAFDSLVIDHCGPSQIAVAHCFEQGNDWIPDREVIFFTCYGEWIPIEITQLLTGWTAYAKLDAESRRVVRINHCGQEKLAEFSECWAHKLVRQNWLEQGMLYQFWAPPSRKEIR